MKANDLADRLELALAATREAGAITLRYFQRDNYSWSSRPTPRP